MSRSTANSFSPDHRFSRAEVAEAVDLVASEPRRRRLLMNVTMGHRTLAVRQSAVTTLVRRPKHFRRPRATLYSPPPSQTLNSRAVRMRPSPAAGPTPPPRPAWNVGVGSCVRSCAPVACASASSPPALPTARSGRPDQPSIVGACAVPRTSPPPSVSCLANPPPPASTAWWSRLRVGRFSLSARRTSTPLPLMAPG